MNDTIYNRKLWLDKFIYREPADMCDEERVGTIMAMVPDDVKDILDVGLGGGYVYRRLKSGKGLRCFGIDISETLVRAIKDGDTCVADAGYLPFKDGQFDLILAADLIEHLPNDSFSDSIAEFIRVTKKYIIINSPYRDVINWPVALCNKCKREFNIYGHLRAINRSVLRDAFPDHLFDTVTEKVMGRKRAAWPAPMVFFARRFGKVYSAEAAVCPYCSNETVSCPERNAIEKMVGKFFCGMLLLANRITPPVLKCGSEICVLFKKREHE